MRRYTNVALPDEMIERIDKLVKEDDLGYKSRGEFVKEAVRHLLLNLTKLKKIKIKK